MQIIIILDSCLTFFKVLRAKSFDDDTIMVMAVFKCFPLESKFTVGSQAVSSE